VSLLTDASDEASLLANPLNKMFQQALGVMSLVGAAGGIMAAGGSTGGAAGGHHALIPVPPRPTPSDTVGQPEDSGGGGRGATSPISSNDSNGHSSSTIKEQGSLHHGPARFTQGASPSVLKPMPGAGLVLWALSEGYEAVEKVWSQV
jgi:hypothetical protein